jgi:ribosomal protein S24E
MKRLELKENPILARREAKYLFEEGAGKLTRLEAQKLVAADLGVKEEQVITISLRNSHGTRNQIGYFRVYDNPSEARLQIPKYVFVRNLQKEERKKLIEEEKKKKAPKVAKAK